jgi:Zn-dependent membrane protease YugP
MYFGDLWFWVIMGVSTLLSLGASGLVQLQFSRGRSVPIQSGLTGAEVAQRVLDDAGITDVTIQRSEGFLSDHYNPFDKTLNLSDAVFDGVSAASAGVAAHEVGHAIQHARGYGPMWLRSVLVMPAQLGSSLGPIVIMVGAALGAAHQVASHHYGLGYYIAIAGVILFGAATAFSLVTVPVEFNASARARERLVAIGITRPGEEDDVVRGVLFAAGLTYVAAAATSLMWLIYYAAQAGLLGGRRDDR